MPPTERSSPPPSAGAKGRIGHSKHKSAASASAQSLDPRAVLNLAISERERDIHGQISYFFKHYPIPASQGRTRVVSAKTTSKYVLTVHMFVEALEKMGVKLYSVNELTSRQLMTVMRSWEASGTAASSLATYFSVIKRFYSWVGVKLPFASVHEVLKDPQRGKRSMSATTPKSWSANGVEFQTVLMKVHAQDEVVALQLELAAAFGLRVLEACAFRPLDADRGNHIVVEYGAKGGRGRTVQISSQYQRDVLDKAKKFASTHNGFIRTPRRTQKQAYKRFYNVLQALGISKKGAGISAHGLRHEYANDLYANATGTDSPVNHGAKVSLEEDRAARREITEALGHSRLAITSAYLGSHVQMDRHHKKRLASLNAVLTTTGGAMHLHQRDIQRQAQATEPGAELRIFITGPAADGKEIKGVPIVLGCGLYMPNGMPAMNLLTQHQLHQLASTCQEVMGQWCVAQCNQQIPQDVQRFELMFTDA